MKLVSFISVPSLTSLSTMPLHPSRSKHFLRSIISPPHAFYVHSSRLTYPCHISQSNQPDPLNINLTIEVGWSIWCAVPFSRKLLWMLLLNALLCSAQLAQEVIRNFSGPHNTFWIQEIRIYNASIAAWSKPVQHLLYTHLVVLSSLDYQV